jgi:spore germination protein YaaH
VTGPLDRFAIATHAYQMTRRPLGAALLAALAVTSAFIFMTSRPAADGTTTGPDRSAAAPDATRTAIPIPIPGHEVYGFVPYWEMDDGIAAHLAETDLTTLALFSVTHTKNGDLAPGERGYRKIDGPLGRRLITEAHDRGLRVELVYTSFGSGKNDAFFRSAEAQERTIAGLVALASDLGVDGINVDVELLAAEHVAAYGAFVGRLRAALRAVDGEAQVSVATSANIRGTSMAVAATEAGADRIFMMGYDYHWSGSGPGASAPLDRRDGNERDLVWSLDLYRDAGVPAERTILGLPLYGMSWPVVGPELGAARTGRGSVWVPGDNLGTLRDRTLVPVLDPLEVVEHLPVPDGDGWRAIYFDSPASLTPKLALADARGLAGAGLWAVGYERGLIDYTRLIATFRAGELSTAASPTSP